MELEINGLRNKNTKGEKASKNSQIEPHPRGAIDTKTKNPATLQFSTIKKNWATRAQFTQEL